MVGEILAWLPSASVLRCLALLCHQDDRYRDTKDSGAGDAVERPRLDRWLLQSLMGCSCETPYYSIIHFREVSWSLDWP
jgi:hypothetical protein